MKMKQKHAIFHGTYLNPMPFSYQSIWKYFNDIQNRIFSVLWLKWKQAKCKWNKTRHFVIGRIQIWHHNFLYQKTIKIFQWLSQSKLLSFMMKVSPSNGNKTISHIFSRDIQIWHHIFLYQKLLKYFNDFQNQNFSVLWLKWTQSI